MLCGNSRCFTRNLGIALSGQGCYREAATPQTMYSLASISKPITATGLMTLVERGAIDLDKPANEYLGTGKLTGHADYHRQKPYGICKPTLQVSVVSRRADGPSTCRAKPMLTCPIS